MFYEELNKRLDRNNTDTYAKEMKLSEKQFITKLKQQSFTMDEIFLLIRSMRSLSMMNYIMGELHPPWKEKNSSTLN